MTGVRSAAYRHTSVLVVVTPLRTSVGLTKATAGTKEPISSANQELDKGT